MEQRKREWREAVRRHNLHRLLGCNQLGLKRCGYPYCGCYREDAKDVKDTEGLWEPWVPNSKTNWYGN